MSNKRGPISRKEETFLRDNYQKLTPEQIAKKLGRTVETIKMWMIDLLGVSPDAQTTQVMVEQAAMQKELVNSPEWEALRAEFTLEELKFFKHRYGKLMVQFSKEEVYPTEETQIFMLVKYEILMQRNLKDSKKGVEEGEKIEGMLQKTYEEFGSVREMDDATKSFVMNLENQLQAARAAKQAKSTEYVKLTEKHSALLKELKATRDQRINKLENLKETFLDVIKQFQQEDIRAREGRHMGLVNLAVQKERERLSQLHTYTDNSLDQPLLTPETIREE